MPNLPLITRSISITLLAVPLGLAVANATPPPVVADPPSTPSGTTAAAVIERYIEVTGGREAWLSLTSIRGMGTITLAGLPAVGQVMVSQTRDGFRMDVDMFQTGTGTPVKITHQSTIRNGDLTWREEAGKPPTSITGLARADLLRKSVFNPMLNTAAHYGEIVLEGLDQVNGMPCWKLLLKPIDATASTEIRWFDVADGLMRKVAETPAGGGVTSELLLSDFKPVGPVLLNHVIVVGQLGASFERRFDAMQVDVTIDPCLFEAPESIVESQEPKVDSRSPRPASTPETTRAQ